MNTYHRQTKGLLYSYLFSLPLLLLYELLILISQPGTAYPVRISVDVWFKQLFMSVGLDPVSTTLIVAFLAGGIILYRKKGEFHTVKKHYFLIMATEALFYAIAVSILIRLFLNSLLQLSAEGALMQMGSLQLIALSLGAGLYEELFFRVILVGFLLFVLKKYFSNKTHAYIIAATVAALIFSGVHYVGEFADSFALGSFMFRFMFGLALNFIYVIRGFGMAAWTHALYDIIVVMSR